MEENLQKDDGGLLAPFTPAKLGCTRGSNRAAAGEVQESLNSASADNVKFGGNNSDGNLFDHEEFFDGVGRKSGYSIRDSEKNSRIDDSSGKVGESGKISCMQLFSKFASAKHEVISTVDTSANLSAEETVDIHRHASVNGGSKSASDLSSSEKKRGSKRKKTGIDLNKKPQQRMKVKKHRPKIFDASKPKKIPKVRKEKKNVRKSSKKTPECDPSAPNPHTPEPLHPKRVMSDEITASEEGKFNDNNGRISDQNSGKCRRVLNFDVEDQIKEVRVENVVRDLNEGADEHKDVKRDVASVNCMLASTRKIIHTYQPRRCQKGEDESIFSLLLLTIKSEHLNFDSSNAMRNIIKEYHRQTMAVHTKGLETHLSNLPQAFKQRRSIRWRRTVFSDFWETDKLFNGHQLTTKRRLSSRCNTKENLSLQILNQSLLAVPKRKRSKPYRRHNNLASGSTQMLLTSFPNPVTENLTSTGAQTHPSLGKDNFPVGLLDEADLFPLVPSHNQIQENNQECDNGLLELKLGLPQYEDVTQRQAPLVQKNVPPHVSLQQYRDVTRIQKPLEQKNVPLDDIPDIEDIANSTYDHCTEDLFDVIQKLECLHIMDESRQLVVRDKNATGSLIHYQGRFDRNKPKQATPKVDLDQETMRVWNILMGIESDGSEDSARTNEENEKLWAEQREMFRKRVDSFIARMHLIQGNRRFSRWKGSVVDSIVGVFLTQNVSDHLSSSAYMSLASRFPITSESSDLDAEDKGTPSSQESVGSNTEVERLNDVVSKQPWPSQWEEEIRLQKFSSCQSDLTSASFSTQKTGENEYASRVQEGTICDCSASLSNYEVSLSCGLEEKLITEDNVSFINKHNGGRNGKKTRKNDNDSINRKGKVEEKKENPIDWDELRKTYSSGSSGKNNRGSTMDSVDWDKVRRASLEEIANIIAQRGMHNIIAKRIKNFLDRIVKDHGSIDLEWLRDVPPDKAKEYLLSIDGLGLKSVECVRLLTLHHHAFPVDTNVGRVAVRLGWVPLQPLPEDLEIDLLNNYPLVDSIQKYLWPRLCKLPQHILYELHYQMITFGKVFCTKRQPNCNACPLKAECRHFASAFARAKLRLPGPQEKSVARTNAPNHGASTHRTQSPMPLLNGSYSGTGAQGYDPIIEFPASPGPQGRVSSNGYATQSCDPIIEIPASPEPQQRETLERDIEDLYDDSPFELPKIRLNTEDANVLLATDDMSKALVILTPEAASIPRPKLRTVSRLRTVHRVYELPDSHPLLAEFEKREPDDPCPYLFAVWLSGDAIEEQNDQCISGTILIPCRTANRGRFPLNGTYFQVNEVFADDQTSKRPISVPREWLWTLPTRAVYCGSSATSILKEMELPEIQCCFWRGFVCVRGFDRETREPKPLQNRFHAHGDKEVE